MIERDPAMNCSDYRTLFHRIHDLLDETILPDQKQSCEQHFLICSSCKSWQRQTLELVELSRSMPQFDVSEALTQRILTAVQQEKQSALTVNSLSLTGAGIAATTAVILLLPQESVFGALSWLAAACGLILLQILINSAQSRESLG